MNYKLTINERAHILKGKFGIEREGLRCDTQGELALTPHPKVFGDKLSNPYITTDFSESQVEMITPAFDTSKEAYTFLENLYDITVGEMGEEYFWPQSMPCKIPEESQIPIAQFGGCEEGKEAYAYREKLFKKYGGKKQLVSGIHYNFSFDEKLIEALYAREGGSKTYRTFKDDLYLKVTRNYLRYRWLLIYLLGSTSVMDETYEEKCVAQLQPLKASGYSHEGAISYRNTVCGYTNKEALYPDYTTLTTYVESIKQLVSEKKIESHKELYSPIRLKAKNPKIFLDSLTEQGVSYLEYRSIDVNPFDKTGIALEDLEFLESFNLFLLQKEETTYEKWQQEATMNQERIASYGQKEINVLQDGEEVSKREWGIELLEEMLQMSRDLELSKEAILLKQLEKLKDPTKTYAAQMVERVEKQGYVEANLTLAKAYKTQAIQKSYQLKGYEDLELSTQILMREAIKRGIKVEVIDRTESFIQLERGGNTQYVKQATKTSQDNYVTVLMMENKTVTKKVLETQGVRVPRGKDFDTIEDARLGLTEFVGQPAVIKPKSTNFGLGISIFPEGGTYEDLEKAIEIAFKEDKTILIEEFIQGKEYRFLVIGDEVIGVLHRVPANVVGDGKQTIEALIAQKNLDPLRGVGYKTPLEKIKIDDSLKLFLKQQNLTIDAIPQEGEVIYLRENSNISTGGDSIDYTDDMPKAYKQMAIEAAKAVGANICGVDMMIENYERETVNYGIIELNFNPAIHIHTYPYKGKTRKAAEAILKLLRYIN